MSVADHRSRLAWLTLLPRLARYLPADQFKRLRTLPANFEEFDPETQANIGRELQAAVQSLEPLHRALINYTPRYLLDLNPTPGQPHGELVNGSFIFADVTGFTALTELLSRHGQARGREVMAEIMNRLFANVLDPLISSSGDLLIFAGDAALAFFPRQAEGQDALQAIRAALRMQRAIASFSNLETEYGRCSLTMSIGIERGPAYAGVVGTVRRMELLVSGPAIGAATRAEGQAGPGEVWLGPQIRAIAGPHFNLAGSRVIDDLGETLDDYEIVLPTRKSGRTAIFNLDIPDLLQTLDTALQRVERLAPFLPEDVLAQLASNNRYFRLPPEFRPVATQFINIVGVEELAVNQGPELATTALQRYFVRAEDIVTAHEGVISQIDAYGDSFIMLNTFGAPRAHEGTQRYSIAAALQLAEALEQVNREFHLTIPLQQRSGITYGLTFNGEIGAKYRRESVIAGPAVNRAARLMSKAQFGQVILDADIWADVQGAFAGEQLPAARLKGIEGPVVIVNVRQVQFGIRWQPPERPLLERETEQAILTGDLEKLAGNGQGSGWLISGETGLGKSTLAAYLAHQANEHKVLVLSGRGQPHGKHIPLFPWIDLLTGWLDPAGQAAPGQLRERLATELTALDMSNSESALADLLGFSGDKPAAPSVSTRQQTCGASLLESLSSRTQTSPTSSTGGWQALLQDRLKLKDDPASGSTGDKETQPARSTFGQQSLWQQLARRVGGPEVVINLIQQLSRRQPLLAILEDVDWADRDSMTVLKALSVQQDDLPLMLVVTARKPAAMAEPARLNLKPLSDEAIREVAQRALGARSLDSNLAEWICRQAGGNPLYTEALCRELQRADGVYLDRGTGEACWTGLTPTLPLSLHELFLARLDWLPLVRLDILKRAAVIGVWFEEAALVALSRDQPRARVEIGRALEELVQAGFLARVSPTEYRFTHPLLQETIYATLSFAQRQRWHAQMGDWLCRQLDETGQPQSRPSLELLTYHYLQSSDVEQGARFGLQAAHKARGQGFYAGALEYYQQVLALNGAPAADRMQAAESQADLLAGRKDYGAARASYQLAADLGSAGALSKQAILSGDPNLLTQTEFIPALSPWAVGAQSWQLAQNRQFETARQLLTPILAKTSGAARPALEQLAATLAKNQTPGSYEEWLERFVTAAIRPD